MLTNVTFNGLQMLFGRKPLPFT